MREDEKLEAARRYLGSLAGRYERLIQALARRAAITALEDIHRLLPDRAAYRVYRRSLRLVSVMGQPGTWGVQADPRAAGVKKLDSTKTAIYVKPRAGGRAPAAVYVLSKWGPWTVDTIPFIPERNVCLVEYRKVPQSFVVSVAARNRAQKRLWQHTLGQVGKKPSSAKLTAMPPKVGAVPDFALDAMRMEFGLNGVRAMPHWAPALRNLARGGLRAISREEHLLRLLDGADQSWRLPAPRSAVISQGEAASIDFFQKRLR